MRGGVTLRFVDGAVSALVRLAVPLRRLPHHRLGERRRRRQLVPARRLQVVAHRLLVERRRARAGSVAVQRPEPRRVRRQRLVDQDQLAVEQAELELGVRHDDPALQGVVVRGRVERDALLFQQRRQLSAERVRQLGARHRLVVALGRLRGRREARLGQLARFEQARRQRLAGQRTLTAILGPARARQVAAHHALDVEALAALDQHRPASQALALRLEARPGNRQGRRSGSDWARCRPAARTRTPTASRGRSPCRDRLAHHHVERRQPIGRDEQQLGRPGRRSRGPCPKRAAGPRSGRSRRARARATARNGCRYLSWSTRHGLLLTM